jgi:hypothetical protein
MAVTDAVARREDDGDGFENQKKPVCEGELCRSKVFCHSKL